MSLVELIEKYRQQPLTYPDGEPCEVELLPPLSRQEIDEFAASLPCPLPQDVRDLLAHCRGITGFTEDIEFTREYEAMAPEAFFPHGRSICPDGCGNYWVVDLNESSTNFGPIYFVDHDPACIIYQSTDLYEFLDEWFRAMIPPHRSVVQEVADHSERVAQRMNAILRPQRECMESEDTELRSFARELDERWQIADFRDAEPGDGFEWLQVGPRTPVRRHDRLPLFAYRKPATFWQRLFG